MHKPINSPAMFYIPSTPLANLLWVKKKIRVQANSIIVSSVFCPPPTPRDLFPYARLPSLVQFLSLFPLPIPNQHGRNPISSLTDFPWTLCKMVWWIENSLCLKSSLFVNQLVGRFVCPFFCQIISLLYLPSCEINNLPTLQLWHTSQYSFWIYLTL